MKLDTNRMVAWARELSKWAQQAESPNIKRQCSMVIVGDASCLLGSGYFVLPDMFMLNHRVIRGEEEEEEKTSFIALLPWVHSLGGHLVGPLATNLVG